MDMQFLPLSVVVHGLKHELYKYDKRRIEKNRHVSKCAGVSSWVMWLGFSLAGNLVLLLVFIHSVLV